MAAAPPSVFKAERKFRSEVSYESVATARRFDSKHEFVGTVALQVYCGLFMQLVEILKLCSISSKASTV
jgi:hypothetical protein